MATFTIHNQGTAPLTIGDATIGPGEELTYDCPGLDYALNKPRQFKPRQFRPVAVRIEVPESPPLYGDPRVTDEPLASLGVGRRVANKLKTAHEAAQQGVPEKFIHLTWCEESAFVPQEVPGMTDEERKCFALEKGWTFLWSNPTNLTEWSFIEPERYVVSPERAAELGLPLDQLTAGVAAMLDYEEGDDAGEAAAIYRAMHAVAPVPLITEAEDRVAALEAALKTRTDERDAAVDRAGYWKELAAGYDRHMRAEIAARDVVIKTQFDSIATQHDIELLLRDQLAQRPAPVPDTPKPAHDFTRVEGGDRRRMGG